MQRTCRGEPELQTHHDQVHQSCHCALPPPQFLWNGTDDMLTEHEAAKYADQQIPTDARSQSFLRVSTRK